MVLLNIENRVSSRSELHLVLCSKHFKVQSNKSKAHRDVGTAYTNCTESSLRILRQQQYLSIGVRFDSQVFGAIWSICMAGT